MLINETIIENTVVIIVGIIVKGERDKILVTKAQSITATTIVVGTDLRLNPINTDIAENPPAIIAISKVIKIDLFIILIERLSLTIGKIDSLKKNITNIIKLLKIIPPTVNKVTNKNLE